MKKKFEKLSRKELITAIVSRETLLINIHTCFTKMLEHNAQTMDSITFRNAFLDLARDAKEKCEEILIN